MPNLAYGTSAYSRTRGNLPELPLINLFVEQSPSEGEQPVLQSRPGLEVVHDYGLPVEAIFQQDGVLGGARFVIAGGELYKDTALVGQIIGTGPISFAASQTQLAITAGGAIHVTDGSTLTTVDFPDSADVAAVTFLGGYFIAVRKGTHQFYWSALLDALLWDALDYASAENEPDQLRDVLVMNDLLVLIGSASVEFWPRTGLAETPFAPMEGRVFEKGARATGCSKAFDNSFIYVAPDNIVYRAGQVPERISDYGIEEAIKHSTWCKVFTFDFEGHLFGVVHLDNGTFAYDAATRQWSQFQTYGQPNWAVQCAVEGFFGGKRLFKFGGFIDDGDILERRFRAGFTLNGGGVSADSIRLRANTGQTGDLVGVYADPKVEMRISRDAGQCWSAFRSISLGKQGEYRHRVEWRRNGMIDAPGGLFEFRVTDPVPVRISGCAINEPSGGRSR